MFLGCDNKTFCGQEATEYNAAAFALSDAGYEAADAAGIGDMMIQYLSHTSSSNTSSCVELITEGVLGLCTQPLFSLHLSRSAAALSICASR